jgi:Transposase DDE domain group 1
MTTDCIAPTLEFQAPGRRVGVARFDGGPLSSEGGGLLLAEVERRRGLIRSFARCFTDHRNPLFTEHSVFEMVAQRVFGLALGYEDLNDHDELRTDPLLATLVGKSDLLGTRRRLPRDRGKALAASSTLNRLEWAASSGSGQQRYHKISLDAESVDRFFVEAFVSAHDQPPESIVLDLDATDDPIHGQQEGRFFHGYYGGYCYLPLYIFCGTHLLCARLRPSNIDASAGSVEEVHRIVGQIREAWPEVEIVLRGDSGFAREELMRWCEDHRVEYVFGLARNPRLQQQIQKQLETVRRRSHRTGQPQRVFKEFWYQTLDSWSRRRRVVAKAEHLEKGSNPRFVVTSLSNRRYRKQELYETTYCGRGEMENRIKEQQLFLFADRTSARTMQVNQLRLWFSSVAYLLLNELRRLGLEGTEMARARCDTLRLKLLKVAAKVTISVRRVVVSLASSCPYQSLFLHAYQELRAGPAAA